MSHHSSFTTTHWTPTRTTWTPNQWRAFVLDFIASLPEERRILVNRYRAVDIAQKVVGVGSVGTRCAIVLAMGGSEGDDPLFMQIKEASASVLEPYLGASPYKNHGERVVIGQRMMQTTSDILLGWSTFNGRDFYTRQLRDMKFSAEIETMNPRSCSPTTSRCAPGLWRARMPVRVIQRQSLATWAARIRSTRLSPHSPKPTRIRLSATMRFSLPPSKKGAFKPRLACDIQIQISPGDASKIHSFSAGSGDVFVEVLRRSSRP